MNKNANDVEYTWIEFQHKLFLLIKGKVASSEDAEDILNDVFVSLIKKTVDSSSPDNVTPWRYPWPAESAAP